MPSVAMEAFINRKMNAMLMAHLFCCFLCDLLGWIWHLSHPIAPSDMGIDGESTPGIPRDEEIAERMLMVQLIPEPQAEIS